MMMMMEMMMMMMIVVVIAIAMVIKEIRVALVLDKSITWSLGRFDLSYKDSFHVTETNNKYYASVLKSLLVTQWMTTSTGHRLYLLIVILHGIHSRLIKHKNSPLIWIEIQNLPHALKEELLIIKTAQKAKVNPLYLQ